MRNQRNVIAVAAALSAVAACFASTAPTGVSGVDLVQRALFAAGLTYLSSRARPLALIAVAGIVLVGAGNGIAISLSLVAVGAAVLVNSAGLARDHKFALTAISGVALSQALLRLGTLESDRATTFIAVTATLVLVCACIRDTRSQRRIALGVVGLVAVVVPVSLFVWQKERAQITTATSSIEAGIQAARTGETDEAKAQLKRASSAFRELETDLGAWWIRPARAIPGVAQQLVAARSLVAAGVELSDVAADLASEVDPSQVKFERGRVDLTALAALAEPLRRAADSLDAAREQTSGVRTTWLLPSIRSAFDDFQQRTNRAAEAARRGSAAVAVAPELLGANGQRRYFLALQTNAEMRGTGGLIGNYGVLTATSGAIALERFGRIDELNPPQSSSRRLNIVGPADYVARYRDSFTLGEHFQNATASPDFPSVGEVITNLAPQAGLGEVDGAIAIDAFGLAALLRVTGPVTVPDWPEPLNADNAAEILNYRQYVTFGDEANADRVEFLASTSEAVFERLTTGELSGIGALVDALAPAVRAKHVQLYSANSAAQKVLVTTDIAGAMAPVAVDFLGVVTQDATPSKLDWFQRRSIKYKAVVDPQTREINSIATVTVRNTAPATGLPRLAYGLSHWGLEPNTARVYVSIYSPLSLGEAMVNGQPVTMESANELKRFVYSTFLIIPHGGTATVELKLSGLLPPTGDYEIFFSRQPAVQPDDLSFTITRAGAGKPLLSEDLALDSDTSRNVRIRP